jgi:hypothetical protein
VCNKLPLYFFLFSSLCQKNLDKKKNPNAFVSLLGISRRENINIGRIVKTKINENKTDSVGEEFTLPTP